MKEIRAIIRPKCLSNLRQALREIPDFPGVTVFKGEGFAAPGEVGKRTVREELTDFSEKVLITVITHDAMVKVIAETILRECRTGHLGDGLLWILPIDGVQCIRDGKWMQAPGTDAG
ncbi:MAG: P-II family nitrogen regulator [Candidatus Thermoplasmatota archaeon]|nr:P-II family nitrogen regulator [Candidatus Thermoplasmatota archaeon]